MPIWQMLLTREQAVSTSTTTKSTSGSAPAPMLVMTFIGRNIPCPARFAMFAPQQGFDFATGVPIFLA